MMTGDLETGAAIAAGEVNTENRKVRGPFRNDTSQVSFACWLKISVVCAGHADPQLVPRGHTGHILLSDPGDPVHAGDEALHPGHEADARILAIEAQQEPVTLAMS